MKKLEKRKKKIDTEREDDKGRKRKR